VTEVKWSVPDGFKVAEEPAKLDGSLVGEFCLLEVGALRLAARKDHRSDHQLDSSPLQGIQLPHITWSVDNYKGPSKLAAESYAQGADARYNSWVILKRV
jgi:hypothetical protein